MATPPPPPPNKQQPLRGTLAYSLLPPFLVPRASLENKNKDGSGDTVYDDHQFSARGERMIFFSFFFIKKIIINHMYE